MVCAIRAVASCPPALPVLVPVLISTMVRFTTACNKETKEVGICLHVYLERDFPAIEPAVYRMHHAGRSTGRNSKLFEDYAFSGPSLEDSCNKLRGVIECFENILEADVCYYYEDFFTFRHLIESIWTTFQWFCDKSHLTTRYLALLRNWECIEEVRVRSRSCRNPEGRLPKNVWQRIIRSEENTTICRDLIAQRNCLVTGHEIARFCGSENAEEVYKNATDLFLASWCVSSASRAILCPALGLLLFYITSGAMISANLLEISV